MFPYWKCGLEFLSLKIGEKTPLFSHFFCEGGPQSTSIFDGPLALFNILLNVPLLEEWCKLREEEGTAAEDPACCIPLINTGAVVSSGPDTLGTPWTFKGTLSTLLQGQDSKVPQWKTLRQPKHGSRIPFKV